MVEGFSSSTVGSSASVSISRVGALESAMTAKPVGDAESPTIAASTSPDSTRASASARSAASVTSRPGTSCTYCWASAVTATGVPLVEPAWMPPQTTRASAPRKRMIVEIRKALLRIFEAISRSATSQTLCGVVGAGVDAMLTG